MPGPPPRQHKHERQYTPSTHSVIPTRRIWNDDYDGQMIFGDLGDLNFPDICLTGEGKPRKKLIKTFFKSAVNNFVLRIIEIWTLNFMFLTRTLGGRVKYIVFGALFYNGERKKKCS